MLDAKDIAALRETASEVRTSTLRKVNRSRTRDSSGLGFLVTDDIQDTVYSCNIFANGTQDTEAGGKPVTRLRFKVTVPFDFSCAPSDLVSIDGVIYEVIDPVSVPSGVIRYMMVARYD